MPKSFTEEELEFIKEQLLIKGKELFIKYGYKKVGIRDLTSEIGIANGMFYKFFKSKEELFFLILKNEKKKVRNKIYSEIVKNRDEPMEALRSFYYVIVKELEDNPMMKTILSKEEYTSLTSKMTEEQMLEEREESLNPILEITEYWRKKNLIKDVDMEMVIRSLRSLVLLWFHKDEIGIDNYPIIIEFMINRICEYVKKE